MKVTIAPCAPAKVSGKVATRSPLLEIAEAVFEDCKHQVTVEVLDAEGHREAVLGGEQEGDGDDIELF